MRNSIDFNRAYQYCIYLKHYLKGEAHIDKVAIEIYKEYIKEASQSFYFFNKAVLGFDKLTSQTHKLWCEDLQKSFWKNDFLMRLKPRETYKTTIYGEGLILWVWATISSEIRFFYTSANSSLLQEVGAHLDTFIGFDTESLYSFVFGIKRDPTQRPNTGDVVNITGKNKEVKGSSLMFRTAGGSVNGVHPHIIIVDDPMDKDDRESETIRKKKERWFDSLFPLLSTYKLNEFSVEKIMFIATRWHMNDLVSYVKKKNDGKEFENEKFQIEVEGVYKDESRRIVSYPEFFPESKIRKKRENMSDVFFACQYMNNPLPEGMLIFDEKRMHFFDIDMLDIRKGRSVCILDPSKGKKTSDYPAVVWANLLSNKLRFFDAIDKKVRLADLLKRIAQKNKYYNIPEIIFESNSTMMLEENIEIAHKEVDHPITISEIWHSDNKHERILGMQPVLYNGTTQFRKDYKSAYQEMMNQIFYYPVWGNDDFPDVVEMTIAHLLKGGFEFIAIGADGVIELENPLPPVEKSGNDIADAFEMLLYDQ